MVLTKGRDLLPKACVESRLSATRLSLAAAAFSQPRSFAEEGLFRSYTANKVAGFAVLFSIELALQVPRYG